MNYTQNQKIHQITSSTLIIGIDIAKDKHVARAQDDRGIEFGKRLIFENRIHGLEQLIEWAEHHAKAQGKNTILFGAEPTGHYWKNLAYYLTAKGFQIVVVNPMHVKKSKELDDNSPTKNDTKDAKVIAQLMKDGRYSVPNLLEGIYAELREGVKIRDQLVEQLMITEGRIQNLIQRYFPEFFDVFGDWAGKAALCTLKLFPFPAQIAQRTPEEVLQEWKPYVQRGVGIKRATKLVEAANKSIGLSVGLTFARREMSGLLEQYELFQTQLAKIDRDLEEVVQTIPGAKEMMAVKGLGVATVTTILSETGDLSKYRHPQQLVNLAGLSLRENSSGKFRGQTKITKRGRSKLRRALYLAIRPLVAHNPAFQALHHYYTKRSEKPLKKQQSLIALCGKLLKVIFVMGQRQCPFEGEKLLQGIPQGDVFPAA